jgi:hypothetical protein
MKMDRMSCLSYLLYQCDDEEVKDVAIKLLNGDLFLKEAKQMKRIYPHIIAAESLQKRKGIDDRKVAQFVEQYMLMEV